MAKKNSGQFKKGNQAAKGKGRPPREIEQRFLIKVSDLVDDESWQKVVERALSDAQDGDDRARAWLTKLLVGDLTLLKLSSYDADMKELEKSRSFHDALSGGWGGASKWSDLDDDD